MMLSPLHSPCESSPGYVCKDRRLDGGYTVSTTILETLPRNGIRYNSRRVAEVAAAASAAAGG